MAKPGCLGHIAHRLCGLPHHAHVCCILTLVGIASGLGPPVGPQSPLIVVSHPGRNPERATHILYPRFTYIEEWEQEVDRQSPIRGEAPCHASSASDGALSGLRDARRSHRVGRVSLW